MTAQPASPFLNAVVAWLVAVWIWAAVAPFDRRDWLLENLLVFAYAAVLWATYRRFAFSNRVYGLFALFLTLHLVGSHYTYSEVPFGAWVRDWLGLSRNHFDRLVHFSYGLLLAPAFREVLLRMAHVSRGWSAFLAVNLVLAFSALFEVVEAIVAMMVDPALGVAYLGTQGDGWDAQHDMGLAFGGATLTMTVAVLRERRRGFTSSSG